MVDNEQNSGLQPSSGSEKELELAHADERERQLIEHLAGGKGKYVRFVLSALSVIPWFGVASAAGSFVGEKGQEKTNELLKLWIQEHREKAKELARTIQEIVARLDGVGSQIDERIQSPEYLAIVKTAFKSWDDADTHEKREMFKKLIANAAIAPTEVSPDDLIRLFVNWLNQYHEAHFLVIREIYSTPGITRAEIWDRIHQGGRPREDSLEADLFKYLIRELNLGEVIRQVRETDSEGNFLRKMPAARPKGYAASRIAESAFEDSKPYVLTELGKQFVHYVMDDIVPLIEKGSQ